MVTEHVTFAVEPARRDEFESEAVPRARAILERLGAHAIVVGRAVEDPTTYVMTAHWESVGAHMSIIDDPELAAFRDWSDSFYSSPPVLVHLEPVEGNTT